MGNNIISTATTTVYVNGEHAAKTLQQLKRDAMNLRSSLAEAVAAGDTSKAKGLNKSLREVRREIREIESAAQSAETVMRRLDKATPRELRTALRQLNKELENIERGSEAWKAHVEKIKRVKAEIASLDAETKQHQSLWSRFASMMFNWGDAIDAVSSSVTGLMSATRSAVNAYAEMEQEMANVRKFTGMTAEQVADLNEEFMKMDTRTSREELNKLAQQAGRLGKTSQEDVMGFVRAADKINVALDDLGEDATLTLSKLTGIFGDEKRLGTEKALLSVGSVINELSQNCSASAPYLADFASRMGGVGSQAGMTVQQIMAFGAVLDSNNQAVEASATALSQVIMRIYQEPQKYAQVAGLDIKKFSELVKTDMNSALLMLLESLSKVGKMDVLAPMFKDMGETGARAAAALSTLVGHIDEVKSQQLEANRAFAEAVSVGKEFDVQNNTVQAGLDKAKKRFNELAVSLGEKLLPYMEFAVSMSSVFLRVLRVLVDFLSEHGKSVMTLTAAVVGYYIAAGIAVIKTKALAAAAALHRAASTAQAAAVSLLNIAMLLLKGRLHAAKQEFLAFSTTLKANPLGIILGLLSAAAAALYFFTRQTDAAAEAQNNLNKIRKDAQEEISGEKLKIDLLVKAAKNERLSLEERHKAIDALNRIVPGYNAGLDDTTGKYRENKEALDAYLKSLARKYEIEGAKAKLEELGKTKADAAIEVADAEKKLKKLDKSSMQGSGLVGSDDAAAVAFDLGRREAVLSRMKTAQRRMTLAEETEKLIMEAYGSDLYKNAVEDASKGTGNGSNGGVSGSGAGSAASKSTAAEGDRFKAENKWRAREEALSRIKNATGEIDEEQHQKRMLEIQLEYLQKKMDNERASADEILQFRAEYAETERKLQDNKQQDDKQSADAYYAEKMAVLKQQYIDGKISAETYNGESERIEIEHLRTMVYLYKQGLAERADAEAAYRDKLFEVQQRKRADTEAAEKKHQDALKKIRQESFGEADIEGYTSDLAMLDEAKAQMLAGAAADNEERLRIEEAYLKAKLVLQKKYGIKEREQSLSVLGKMAEDFDEWIESDGGKAFTGMLDAVSSQMSAIFSQLSSSVQSGLELQTAAIESRYEREISAAEGNNYKIRRLEQQRDEEIAKAKNDANRKQFSMQVIQAVAQTAQNALNAYGSAAAIPLVGHIYAPIAAAAAVAAGMLQVAAIKKQQQAAASQGYAEGGFTKPGGRYEPAGIVHAGEWVASQSLVKSPVARPLIDALDYAQRTNTIGSLRAADVSRSVTAPSVVAAAASDGSVMAALAAAVSFSADTIRRLNARLDEPFVTVNTVTGDNGIKQAQDEYSSLIRNKTPKSRRK